MKPIVGWGLGGSTHGRREARGSLGEPVWGPHELLRDLELRLGLPAEDAPLGVRLPRWQARIASLADATAFYARSFQVDPLGTAQTLLAWRDSLVEAGWDGAPIPQGGERLAALAAIEALAEPELPLAMVDRLVRVERTLAQSRIASPYWELSLVEARELWSVRWQRVFARLAAMGTKLTGVSVTVQLAPESTDLGKLQRVMRGELSGADAVMTGDGSLRMLRGDTAAELADLAAGWTAQHRDGALVVRCDDAAPLESAFAHHGLASLGHVSASTWRPAMQLLPLTLELAYEPRDPYRLLELLTLPVGPFRGIVGSTLARAVAKQPGIGGQEWTRAKEQLVNVLAAREREAANDGDEAAAQARARERMELVHVWLESEGASTAGATREHLLEVAARVRAWLQARLKGEHGGVYGSAFAQARALELALANEPRSTLTREELRQLFDTVVRSEALEAISTEEAGRVAHVSHPSAVLAGARNVLFWGFVAGTERRPQPTPWTAAERAALEAVGVRIIDSARLLATESESWRRAVLAASERVMFVAPARELGEATAPHPLWDEICARLGLTEHTAEKLVVDAQSVLRRGHELARVDALTALPLPAPRGEWNLPSGEPNLQSIGDVSVSAISTLASCPLSWVLQKRAHLRSGAVAKLAEGPILYGNLCHRLVEALTLAGAFDHDEAPFLDAAASALEELIRHEAATLLLPGTTIERAQLIDQVLHAMRELHGYLRAAGFRIANVERPVSVAWALGNVNGRLDLELVDAEGNPAVLDLKWGASTYRKLLTDGRAVQLAAYARAIAPAGSQGKLPPAGYFALSSATVLAADDRMHAPKPIDGPALEQTWSAVERTAVAVAKSLQRGRIPVAGTRDARPLLEVLEIEAAERPKHFEAEPEEPCTYCEHHALCGRAWETLR